MALMLDKEAWPFSSTVVKAFGTKRIPLKTRTCGGWSDSSLVGAGGGERPAGSKAS